MYSACCGIDFILYQTHTNKRYENVKPYRLVDTSVENNWY